MFKKNLQIHFDLLKGCLLIIVVAFFDLYNFNISLWLLVLPRNSIGTKKNAFNFFRKYLKVRKSLKVQSKG